MVFNSRADFKSCPNGFSMISRFQPFVEPKPLSLIFKAIGQKIQDRLIGKTFDFPGYLVLFHVALQGLVVFQSHLLLSHQEHCIERHQGTIHFAAIIFNPSRKGSH